MDARYEPDLTSSALSSPAADTGWRAVLAVLDRLLGIAVERQARLLGPASLLDPWRGMYLDQADVERLLAQDSDHTLIGDKTVVRLLADAMRGVPQIASLAESLAFQACDLAILLIVLAPDIELRYERIYSYLQDDIVRKRPSLDLFGNLLARNAQESIALRTRFGRQAPLLRFAILREGGSEDVALLARPWRADDIWRAWLLNERVPSIEGCTFSAPGRGPTLDTLGHETASCELLKQSCKAVKAQGLPLRLLLLGPHGCGKLATGQAIARRLRLSEFRLDVRDLTTGHEMHVRVERAARAASLFGALLMVHGIDQLEGRDPQLVRAMVEALAEARCHFVLLCTATWPALHAGPLPLIRVPLGFPSVSKRSQLWRGALDACGANVSTEACDKVAARFALSAAQISQAAAEVQVLALTLKTPAVDYLELAVAACAQCGTELARMAQRITPRADFSALVVPLEVRSQLREICNRVATRETVRITWAAGSVHARSSGVTVLFVGPSGTGKTLSAEAVARELGLDLFRIDLAGIVSKYIGETEKNLDRVFAAAEYANAVLFFDEADALFGKRSEVKDAHDRHANIEVAYLLQKMEQFDGLAVLATNLKQNLDEAFARRLTFTVNFPFPEEAERRLLWEALWPPHAPRANDVDLAWFAGEFRLSGGNIRNTVMAAAHLAATDGVAIGRAHLLHATRREFQKLGKNLVHPAISDAAKAGGAGSAT